VILLKVLARTTTISRVPIADHDRFPTYYGSEFAAKWLLLLLNLHFLKLYKSHEKPAENKAANRRTRIVILPQLDQFFQLLEPKKNPS